MANPLHSDTEILAEHFGYPPVSLLDDIINAVNFIAQRALDSVETGLLKLPPAALGFGKKPSSKKKGRSQRNTEDAAAAVAAADDQEDPEEAREREVLGGTHQLETLMFSSIDRTFDRFELYVMRNILCVRPQDRPWIRLAHYDGLDLSFLRGRERRERARNREKADGDESMEGAGEAAAGTPGTADSGIDSNNSNSNSNSNNDRPTVQSVIRLHRRLQASQQLNCMLRAEKARNAAMLDALRGFFDDGAPTTTAAGPETVAKRKGDASNDGIATPRPTRPSDTNPQQKVQQQQLHQQKDEHAMDVDDLGARSAPPAAAAAATNQNRAPPFAFLHDRGDLTSSGDAETPLTTTAAFALSQLQALRALSTSLRSILPHLGDNREARDGSGDDDNDDNDDDDGDDDKDREEGSEERKRKRKKKSWRRERVEYVEAATRRHIERVRGLELGAAGEVRDGEWQGGGRKLGGGEVQGLEMVVGLLGEEESGRGLNAEQGGLGGGDEDEDSRMDVP